ncbi:MAG: tRNA (cytidine(56)-2'-O)-methyltransferase [Desulfurococcales archaeon]|nr:tRNA (cytidine(56)-2'-O)-methyltransferase [Desulfurococcales archaeon]
MHPADKYGRVFVLRIGHRPQRDKRVTTHVALAARAFGANGFILGDTCDPSIMESIRRVVELWGGPFHSECGVNSVRYASKWREEGGEVIHLTMYGLPVEELIDEIRSSSREKLIVVGAEKTPRDFYEIASYNVAIGNQPHSEVSALAVFLDRLFRGEWARIQFKGAKLKIQPSPREKKIVSLRE